LVCTNIENEFVFLCDDSTSRKSNYHGQWVGENKLHKIRMHNQPSQQHWFEIDWNSSEHDNSSSSLPSSSSQSSYESSSSSSSDNETPPLDTLEERIVFFF
jgi:hypothetical protein